MGLFILSISTYIYTQFLRNRLKIKNKIHSIMSAIAITSDTMLALHGKQRPLQTSVIQTTRGAQGAYQKYIVQYQYVPSAKTIDVNELYIFNLLVAQFNATSQWLDSFDFSVAQSSETYRQIRLLYDSMIEARKEAIVISMSQKQISLLPQHHTDLLDAILRQQNAFDRFTQSVESYLKELDNPIEDYQSLYFKRMSEKEVWENRCKAYSYRI